MKITKMLTVLVVALGFLVCSAQFAGAAPIGTAFTYQGHLYDANYPANGFYDFQFKLFDDPNVITGNQVGSDVNVPDVDIIDGYFTVELDFGSGVFDGNSVWLEIGVRPGDMNDPNTYTTLNPRQEVTPTPYALQTRGIFVDDAGNVGIGTSSPEKRLDIASESYTDLGIGLNIKSPGGTNWDIDNDGGVFKIVEHAACGPEFLDNTRIAVVGNCIGSPYGGNIGIGTAEPGAKLDVDGQVQATIFGDRDDANNYADLSNNETSIFAQGGLRLGQATTRTPANGGPSKKIIIRHFVTTNRTDGTVIFETPKWQLKRDGTNERFRLRSTSSSNTIYWARYGSTYIESDNPGPGVEVTINTGDNRNLEIWFGYPFSSDGDFAYINIARYSGDYYWMGYIVTTCAN